MDDDMLSGANPERARRESSGGDADAASQEEALAHLTDIALRIKEAIEDRDPAALQAIIAPDAKINIDGRFITTAELAEEANKVLGPMEQPTFDIISIEGSDIGPRAALVSYLTELSWVDQKVWEEHSIKGVLTLHHTRAKKGWTTDGFTYARRPDVPRVDDVGTGRPAAEPAGGFGGLSGLFGRTGAKDGDIWSMWY